MKDYTIWLKGGNSIGGTAKEDDLIGLKECFKKVKHRSYSGYEFEDTEGIVCVCLSDVQAIAITECTENKDIGFNTDSQISPDDVKKCAREFSKRLKDSLQEMKR
ncbi:hypothetical protein [Clostridium luticellarii]|uniref:Uncharacterized protein n=1 Tax=Clostridium luticellarii TaxID=1691940 RepID=A0A2T0BQ15_9CLOT|nr:hypothetical protein [Clostridium luticellarii]PRR85973.1 hypothetical protein CLLU_10010 [Clostridium luticellarii]